MNVSLSLENIRLLTCNSTNTAAVPIEEMPFGCLLKARVNQAICKYPHGFSYYVNGKLVLAINTVK